MSRRRLSFRLNDDESAVVAPTEWWDAIADHFESFRDEDEAWEQAADHVREWVERTKKKVQ